MQLWPVNNFCDNVNGFWVQNSRVFYLYTEKGNISMYKGHSVSQDVAIQETVQKHRACTCRYYSQVGVYVQECTYVSYTNIILLMTLFGS
jgi:hypothetical protein